MMYSCCLIFNILLSLCDLCVCVCENVQLDVFPQNKLSNQTLFSEGLEEIIYNGDKKSSFFII